jgi:hypothetical protein
VAYNYPNELKDPNTVQVLVAVHTMVKLTISVRLAVPVGALPPNHFGVTLLPPLITTALGMYGVAPCVIISVVVMVRPAVPGILLKSAVKFEISGVTTNIAA